MHLVTDGQSSYLLCQVNIIPVNWWTDATECYQIQRPNSKIDAKHNCYPIFFLFINKWFSWLCSDNVNNVIVSNDRRLLTMTVLPVHFSQDSPSILWTGHDLKDASYRRLLSVWCNRWRGRRHGRKASCSSASLTCCRRQPYLYSINNRCPCLYI